MNNEIKEGLKNGRLEKVLIMGTEYDHEQLCKAFNKYKKTGMLNIDIYAKILGDAMRKIDNMEHTRVHKLYGKIREVNNAKRTRDGYKRRNDR